MSKTFCILPFVQVVTRTSGSLGPCCMIQQSHLNKQTISEFWKSNDIRDMRNNMLGDLYVKDCSVCYKEEELFGSSMRTQSLQDYGFVGVDYSQKLNAVGWPKTDYPNRIEMHVSNLCNLKCLTCNPRDSSSFLAENKMLGIVSSNQKDFMINDRALIDLVDKLNQGVIDLLDLRGGETMMVPAIKSTLKNLSDHVYKNTVIRIQTNGTMLDQEWQELLTKFNKIEIMLSVDSVDKYNTYIRYPSNWDRIQHFASWVVQQKNIHCFVACTVSNLNVLSLSNLINWCREMNLYCHLTTLTQPDIYKFTNLPQSILESAQARLIECKVPKLNGILSAVAENNTELWKKFCRMIDMRDQHRGNRIFDLYPELKQHWLT